MLVAAAIAEADGNISTVAKHFGVSRTAVQHLVRDTPSLQEVLADAREGMKDDAESSLHKAIRDGQAWAVCFYLKTQAKDRGYIEKQEHEHQHSGAVQLLIKRVVVKRADGPHEPGSGPAPGGDRNPPLASPE